MIQRQKGEPFENKGINNWQLKKEKQHCDEKRNLYVV